MKKTIILLLISALVIPLAASADTISESFYVGTWVLTQRLNHDDGESITLIHLTDDHKAYFIIQTLYDDGSPGSGRTAVKTWSASGNKVVVQIGENSKLFLKVKDQNTLQDDEYRPQDLYVRVGSGSQDPAGDLESGLILYPGQYIIGEDLPAGNYRFELYQYESDIYIHRDPDNALWRAFASVTEKSPVYAKITVYDGERLDVVAFPVIIMYAKQIAPAGD